MMASILFATLLASPVDDILRLAEEGRLAEAEALARDARLEPADRHQLLGYLALRARRFERAARSLEHAVALEPGRGAAWLYLGVALHHQGRPRESLAALEQAEVPGASLPGFFALRARAARLAGSSSTAWACLEAGLERFEADPGLIREQVGLLFEVRAIGAATRRAERLFEVTTRPIRDRLWVARALIDSGALAEAAPALEAALAHRAKSPSTSPGAPSRGAIRAQLAWVYARLGRPRAAARLLDPVRLGTGEHAYEAADQWRIAGDITRALAANRYVEAPTKRLRQRLLILVEAGALERAAALGEGLDPSALDALTTYALAYALALTGRLDKARALAARIVDRSAVPGLEALEELLEASHVRGGP